MNSRLTIVPRFLREPDTFFESVRRGKCVRACCFWLATSSILCLAAYGFVTGLAHSPWQALSSAVKMPVLFVGVGLFCMPALYFFSLALGSQLKMAQVAAVLLCGISVTALLLLGLSPVVLIFVLTSENYVFFKLLTVASVMVSGCIGLYYLWRGLVWVNLFNGRVSASVQRVLMGAWLVLYPFVGSQMSWWLSPFVGDPAQPFVLLQPSHGNLYMDVLRTLEQTLSLQPSMSGAQLAWVGGVCLILALAAILGAGLAASIKDGEVK